jgi:Gnt-I system low-affinity gluconate transporter
MITAAGIMAPVVQTLDMKGPALGLMVIAIAAGASIMSHVNDSGFWLISRYFGLSEKDTLRSWTVSVTLVALVGFLGVVVLALFIR